MAAEYEVNIKINSQEIERELGKIDRTVAQIGKPKGRSKRSGVLMDDAELKRLQNAGIYLGQAVQRTDTLARAQDKRARLMNRINELEAKGVSVSRLRQQMGKATKQLADKNFGLLEKEFRLLERSVRLEESKLRIKRSQAAADRDRARFLAGADVGRGQFGPVAPAVQGPRQMIASPIGGATTIPGSPAFLRRQQRIKTLEQVGLGAGFPLLFGGGAGSILGGGLGGLTGSFGAQIAFSAIGQQIDQFVASIAAVGTALTSASGTVEMFREKNLFSSDAVKEHAFQLEEQGKMQELATLLTKDLASQIGVNAVKNFQELGGEVKTFLDTINKLFLAVQAFVAGPLAKLLGAINTVLGGVSTEMQFKSLRSSLTGEAAAEFERIFAEARGTRQLTAQERQRAIRQGKTGDQLGPVIGLPTTAAMQRALQDPRTAALRQTIDITGQTNLDDTLGGDTGMSAAAKTAQRLLEASQRRIKILQLETKEIEQITKFKDEIAAAELAGDKRGVARLRRDQALARLKSDEAQAIARINPKLSEQQQSLERINIEAKGVAQAAEIHAEFQRDIAEIIADTNEKFEDQMAHQEELRQKINEQESAYTALNDTFRTGIVDAILAAVEGSESLRDSLLGVIQSMARLILQQQLLNALEGVNLFSPAPSTAGPGGYTVPSDVIPNFFLGKALGGSVSANKPYMVGERGPELFVPGAQGNVVPNNAIGGANVVVNVDASGSQAQGNQPNAKALGAAIGAAVQAELVKQKRPGGLLS